LIIGSVLGVVAVGQYAMAYQLVRIPEWILSAPLYLATFTAVAGLADQPATAGQLSMRAIRMIATVVAPLFVGLALEADLLIGIFLGPKWLPAAPALSVLAFGGLFLCLYSVIGAVLMGLGRADLQLRLSLACGVAMIGGVVIGCRFGLTAATLGLSAGAALVFPLYVRALGRQLMKGAGPIVSTVAWPLAATAVMAGAVLFVRQEVTGWAPPLQLAGSVLTGVLTFLVVLAITAGRQLLEDVKQTLPRRSRPQEVA
jgi:PST family polysaccharide transporter